MGQFMASILELAREVRHRLVARDTGCLTIDYDKEAASIHFSEGTVTTDRGAFLACFDKDPTDFRFLTIDVEPGESSGLGLGALLEAIEAIKPETLHRVWSRYAEWKIAFQFDPDIHNTLVRHHIETKPERLRRLMRLAVSGSLTLEPPRNSISDEVKRINEASAANCRQVLALDENAGEAEIRRAFRKLATRLHPDRWVTTGDPDLKAGAEEAFKRISQAYSELMKPRPIAQASLPAKPEKSIWSGLKKMSRGIIWRGQA